MVYFFLHTTTTAGKPPAILGREIRAGDTEREEEFLNRKEKSGGFQKGIGIRG